MFDYSVSLHYSPISVAFYVALGCFGMFCMYKAKSSEIRTGSVATFRNRYLLAWWFVWVFFAVFRLVDLNIGGSDAPTYINYFQNCNGATMTKFYEHVGSDVGFKWITKCCRYVTGEYRFYFLIVYGFMAFAYIKFVKDFAPAKTNFAPYLLVFFLFLRSYSSIRSNMAIALIALGCTFIAEKKWKSAYLFGFLALLFHKSAVIYASAIPFCHYFFERKLSIKKALILVIGTSLLGRTMQSYFIEYTMTTDLNGAYGSYASRSIGKSFFDSAWKIAFEQLILAAVMLLTYKKIGKGLEGRLLGRFKIIWMLCMFDFMLIPVNFIISSWRGYEFFYLARIVMWGECLYQLTRNMSLRTKNIFNFVAIFAFVAWMVFRINAMWHDTCLLPYVFEPLRRIM